MHEMTLHNWDKSLAILATQPCYKTGTGEQKVLNLGLKN